MGMKLTTASNCHNGQFFVRVSAMEHLKFFTGVTTEVKPEHERHVANYIRDRYLQKVED
ncbi:MAG: hypothetical protein ACE37I_10465 [Rubinisphaera brasiliensis]|uniref:hypothetical protein n=1 Tax=Rubinisphaera brasiliensis TaxID=119 RepID=UPI00391A9DFF